jgi:hypothetical protein
LEQSSGAPDLARALAAAEAGGGDLDRVVLEARDLAGEEGEKRRLSASWKKAVLDAKLLQSLLMIGYCSMVFTEIDGTPATGERPAGHADS